MHIRYKSSVTIARLLLSVHLIMYGHSNMVVPFLIIVAIAACSAQNVPPPQVTTIPVQIIPTTNGMCPSEAQLAEARQEIRDRVYSLTCGGCGDSTWTRVAYLNRSDPTQVCPGSFTSYTSPVRACGRGPLGNSADCRSATFPTSGLTYNRVCGRIIAYQSGHTTGFFRLRNFGTTLEGPYLTGVSVTHGNIGSRQHIWSFASALGEMDFNSLSVQ